MADSSLSLRVESRRLDSDYDSTPSRARLAMPVGEGLVFTGEAAALALWSATAQGASMNGRRAAREILSEEVERSYHDRA